MASLSSQMDKETSPTVEEQLKDITLSQSAYQLSTSQHIILEANPSDYATGCSTGWMTWNASVVLCDYLERNHSTLVQNKLVGDLSSGNGLVAVCLAHLGSQSVVATETKDCVTLTFQNIKLNKVEGKVSVQTYYWGEANNPCLKCSTVTLCDLLYIAIRDSLERELEDTIREMCMSGCTIYFAFEQRLQEEEQSFIARLQESSNGGSEGLVVTQISPDKLNTEKLSPTDESSVEALLWEPPNIKLYTICNSVL
jgi:predicted nicotinamide N-methyase